MGGGPNEVRAAALDVGYQIKKAGEQAAKAAIETYSDTHLYGKSAKSKQEALAAFNASKKKLVDELAELPEQLKGIPELKVLADELDKLYDLENDNEQLKKTMVVEQRSADTNCGRHADPWAQCCDCVDQRAIVHLADSYHYGTKDQDAHQRG